MQENEYFKKEIERSKDKVRFLSDARHNSLGTPSSLAQEKVHKLYEKFMEGTEDFKRPENQEDKEIYSI